MPTNMLEILGKNRNKSEMFPALESLAFHQGRRMLTFDTVIRQISSLWDSSLLYIEMPTLECDMK